MAITLSGITQVGRTRFGDNYPPPPGFTWAFDTGTLIAFSQTNTVRFDNSSINFVTQIGISNVDSTGANRFSTIQSWSNQTNSLGTAYLTVGSTVFQVNSSDYVTFNYRFTGSYYSGSTTLPTSGQVLAISWSTTPP